VIPSEEEAVALHKKYGSSEKIIEHCRSVTEVAKTLADEFQKRGVPVDRKAVVAGAMLHDIGRSRSHEVRHGLEGAEIIEKEGVDAKVVEIVRKHVGAGIAPEEAERLGLPKLDYIPRTLEERIVCFSDKMIASNQVRPFDEEVSKFRAKSLDVERLLALKRKLLVELGTDPEEVVLAKFKVSS
jgi:uncharacterized protein